MLLFEKLPRRKFQTLTLADFQPPMRLGLMTKTGFHLDDYNLRLPMPVIDQHQIHFTEFGLNAAFEYRVPAAHKKPGGKQFSLPPELITCE
tara:strand:- start:11869 stop:12141 length:273 start_codon:yes stop_codon:yes gene_type:complete